MPRKKRPSDSTAPFGTPWGPSQVRSQEVTDQNGAYMDALFFLESNILTRIKWDNLPDGITEREIESILMKTGQCLAFLSETGRPLALRVTQKGKPNVHGDPIHYQAMGEDGWTEDVPTDKGVWIWDTETRRYMYPSLLRTARKLANLDILQDSNRDAQRHIIAFVGTENNVQDLGLLAKDMGMSAKNVFLDKRTFKDGMEPIKAIKLDVDYKQDDFWADKRGLINEFFDKAGIEHIAFEKNAHLLQTEATVVYDSVARVRENLLLPRQRAAKTMTELFKNFIDGPITVSWRKEQYDIMNDTNSPQEGSEDNG